MKKLLLLGLALLFTGCVPRIVRFSPKAVPKVPPRVTTIPKPPPRVVIPTEPVIVKPTKGGDGKGGFKLSHIPFDKLLPGEEKDRKKDSKAGKVVEPMAP